MIKRVVLLLALAAALVACNPAATQSPSLSIPSASPSELSSPSDELMSPSASPSDELSSPSDELMSPSASPS